MGVGPPRKITPTHVEPPEVVLHAHGGEVRAVGGGGGEGGGEGGVREGLRE